MIFSAINVHFDWGFPSYGPRSRSPYKHVQQQAAAENHPDFLPFSAAISRNRWDPKKNTWDSTWSEHHINLWVWQKHGDMWTHVQKQRDSAAHYTAGEMGSMTRGTSVAGAPGRSLNADIVFRLHLNVDRQVITRNDGVFINIFCTAGLHRTGCGAVEHHQRQPPNPANVCLEVGRHRFHIPWGLIHGGGCLMDLLGVLRFGYTPQMAILIAKWINDHIRRLLCRSLAV